MSRRFKVQASCNNRRRSILCASEEEDTRIKDSIDTLKDDFDFFVESIDKLERSGKVEQALSIVYNLSDALNDAIQSSADQIVE